MIFFCPGIQKKRSYMCYPIITIHRLRSNSDLNFLLGASVLLCPPSEELSPLCEQIMFTQQLGFWNELVFFQCTQRTLSFALKSQKLFLLHSELCSLPTNENLHLSVIYFLLPVCFICLNLFFYLFTYIISSLHFPVLPLFLVFAFSPLSPPSPAPSLTPTNFSSISIQKRPPLDINKTCLPRCNKTKHLP